MSLEIQARKLQCPHAHHLFAHPLCKEQSLSKRVARVAFHVFTLCIPLAIYKFIHHFFAKKNVEVQKAETVQKQAIANIQAAEQKPVEAKKPQLEVKEPQLEVNAPLVKVKPPQEPANPVPEQPPLNRDQKRWEGELNFRLKEKDNLGLENFFESLYRVDRDFALPITEDQKAQLNHLEEWLKKEILEIAALPVPVSLEEKWQFSINMLQRMNRQAEAIHQRRLEYVNAGQNIPANLSHLTFVFHQNFEDRLYTWIRQYHETYKDAKWSKAPIQIPMEASTIYMGGGQDYPTLPQQLIWDPSSGQFTARLEFYLAKKGKQVKDIDLTGLEKQYQNAQQAIFAYAGCLHQYDETEFSDEDFQKALEAKLPLMSQPPEPVYRGSYSVMNSEVMMKMLEALIAQKGN